MNALQAFHECERLFTEGCAVCERVAVSADAEEQNALIERFLEIRRQHSEMKLALALLIEREAATLQ